MGIIHTYVQFYREKESHGDIDILLRFGNEHQKLNLKSYITETFKPHEIFYNGGVFSFDYKKIQVDFIPVRQSNWEITKTYMYFDPIGNLTVKIAHGMGLKYGIDGLKYPLRNFNGRLSTDIILSKDPEEIFQFLGFDYEKLKRGFNTLEEIFQFVIKSKYFNANSYLPENRTSRDKKRNKKRKTFNKFITYLKTKKIKGFDIDKDLYKKFHLLCANSFFKDSNLLEKIEKFNKIDSENKEIATKFNGRIIMKHFPNLVGKELGVALTNFKSQFLDFRKFILDHSESEILENFKTWYLKENTKV